MIILDRYEIKYFIFDNCSSLSGSTSLKLFMLCNGFANSNKQFKLVKSIRKKINYKSNKFKIPITD